MKRLLPLLLFVAFAAQSGEKEAVSQVLDQLHQAASEAHQEAYFSLYSDDAIFIGTDATEVWTMAQFKAYATPAFSSGKGWTYVSHDRHIYFSTDKKIAWFDELLDNAGLGLTRGTGVLEKIDGRWKVKQYHLTIPVPNALAGEVARQIKALN